MIYENISVKFFKNEIIQGYIPILLLISERYSFTKNIQEEFWYAI